MLSNSVEENRKLRGLLHEESSPGSTVPAAAAAAVERGATESLVTAFNKVRDWMEPVLTLLQEVGALYVQTGRVLANGDAERVPAREVYLHFRGRPTSVEEVVKDVANKPLARLPGTPHVYVSGEDGLGT